MIGKWLNYMSRLHDGVDAILIADRHGTIEYSAMFSEQENGLIDEGFIGKSILEVYPELTKETSSHFRVMRTGSRSSTRSRCSLISGAGGSCWSPPPSR